METSQRATHVIVHVRSCKFASACVCKSGGGRAPGAQQKGRMGDTAPFLLGYLGSAFFRDGWGQSWGRILVPGFFSSAWEGTALISLFSNGHSLFSLYLLCPNSKPKGYLSNIRLMVIGGSVCYPADPGGGNLKEHSFLWMDDPCV